MGDKRSRGHERRRKSSRSDDPPQFPRVPASAAPRARLRSLGITRAICFITLKSALGTAMARKLLMLPTVMLVSRVFHASRDRSAVLSGGLKNGDGVHLRGYRNARFLPDGLLRWRCALPFLPLFSSSRKTDEGELRSRTSTGNCCAFICRATFLSLCCISLSADAVGRDVVRIIKLKTPRLTLGVPMSDSYDVLTMMHTCVNMIYLIYGGAHGETEHGDIHLSAVMLYLKYSPFS